MCILKVRVFNCLQRSSLSVCVCIMRSIKHAYFFGIIGRGTHNGNVKFCKYFIPAGVYWIHISSSLHWSTIRGYTVPIWIERPFFSRPALLESVIVWSIRNARFGASVAFKFENWHT